jgi:hypothetical protein
MIRGKPSWFENLGFPKVTILPNTSPGCLITTDPSDAVKGWEFGSFHSPQWWRNHWEKTGQVEVTRADLIPDGWKHWLKWQEICLEQGVPADPREADMVRTDAGRNLGFTRILAHKKEEKSGMDLG